MRETATGRRLFACRSIASGTQLFGEDDWADEAERKSFSFLTPQQLGDSAPGDARDVPALCLQHRARADRRHVPSRERVRHPVNFINHSCEPNAGYDGGDAIVALRRISAGEEIRMDYGTFSFSFDHEFSCGCGACGAAARSSGDDWRSLVRTGLRLPGFMRVHADQRLWG